MEGKRAIVPAEYHGTLERSHSFGRTAFLNGYVDGHMRNYNSQEGNIPVEMQRDNKG